MNELVTIKTSMHQTELAVAQSYLENYGIQTFLKDELFSQVYPWIQASGGIKLQVLEEDVMKAVELLIEGGFAKKEDYEIPESTLQMVKIYEKITSFFKKKNEE